MADAMAKGITGFDYEKAFEAAKHSAMLDHLGLEAYKRQGFISMDDEHESVSKTVEYAYDDWCIAQMAMILNKKDEYEYFIKRSQSWKNVFDWNTGFMRPKKNGGWDKPFDPREINNNFTEGNSWQYSFFVPQDIEGMIKAYGGADKFEAKLDEMFNSKSKTTGREQVDVTGLIGQYAHGNEPSHHMAYLYNYVGKPEKTKAKVQYILNEFYKNTPDGLIGNEDCGQMSAWYVLSSMGIYSVTPGTPEWQQTEPIFKTVKINFEDGTSEVLTENSNKSRLGIDMTKTNWVKPLSNPNIIPVPVIIAKSKSFKDSLEIDFDHPHPDYLGSYSYRIVYNNEKGVPFKQYQGEKITLKETATIEVRFAEMIDNQPIRSQIISGNFFKKPNNYTIDIKSIYNPQYHAGGAEGLLDGINGTTNWRKGDWQGYQSQDFEATIDLQTEKTITECNGTFLQDSRSWILMPTKVEYYVSTDNVNFTLAGTVENTLDAQETENTITNFGIKLDKVTKVKYVKIKAYNYGKLPDWHQGAGGDAFIFVDEITIK
jgi:hypothetical protein